MTSELPSWSTFGEQLRLARTARGMSMRALATAAEISAPYVNELEKGRSRPGLDVVVRLCTVLERPVLEWASLLNYRLSGTLGVEMEHPLAGIDLGRVTPGEAFEIIRHLTELRSRT